jgi:hypothetical protein
MGDRDYWERNVRKYDASLRSVLRQPAVISGVV